MQHLSAGSHGERSLLTSPHILSQFHLLAHVGSFQRGYHVEPFTAVSPSCHGNLVSVLVWGSVAVINIMTETNLVEEFILFTG